MPILFAILGLLGVAAVWYYRMKTLGEAASEVADTAARIRGKVKRAKFRKQAEISVFAAIDDPIVGAATIFIALSDAAPSNESNQAKIEEMLSSVSNDTKLIDEAIIYAAWAMEQKRDARAAIVTISPLMREHLNAAQLEDFWNLASEFISEQGATANEGHLALLRKKLGLVVH